MPKHALPTTDRKIAALPKAPAGKRVEYLDAKVTGFGLRVTDRGGKTFFVRVRSRGGEIVRRALGNYIPLDSAELAAARAKYEALPDAEQAKSSFEAFLLANYGATTLPAAREKARAWTATIKRGADPKAEEKRIHDAEKRKRANSFEVVARDFIRLAVVGPKAETPLQRKGAEVARDLENEFIKRWGDRPITEITAHDVVEVLDEAVARGAKYQAHNLLGHVRRLFNWAIARGVYGIENSPCDRMKPKDVIGKKALRKRILSDAEMRIFWKATETLGAERALRGKRRVPPAGYPYGPLFRVLLLTGQRKSEVAEARWSEFDLDKALWVIPAERMKADAAHVVPLTEDVLAVLRSLPRYESGDYLFSTTFGKAPVNGFSKAKAALDKAMLAEIQKSDPKAKLEPFVIHDIRRTMRTGLSALPVPDLVRELVIAHAKPGLHKVYDQFAYLNEKRQALNLWAERVQSIIEPRPASVIPLQARA